MALLALASCRGGRSSERDAAGADAPSERATATDARGDAQVVAPSGATRVGRHDVAHDLVSFATSERAAFALRKSDSNDRWTVELLDETGKATPLGQPVETFADHAAIAPGKNGALLALTLLDDRSGGVFELGREGPTVTLLDGASVGAMFTTVVDDGDYVFAASPLVRIHRPSRKVTKIPGEIEAALLAASAGMLFVAEHRPPTERTPVKYRILSMRSAGAAVSELAKGDGIVYGLAASPSVAVWTVLDTKSAEPEADATGSLWLSDRRGGKPMRLAKGLACPVGVALDRTHAYVALRGGLDEEGQTGGIVRVPLAGGAPEPVAEAIGAPTFVSVDERFVYTFASSRRASVHAPYYTTVSFDTGGDLLAFEK